MKRICINCIYHILNECEDEGCNRCKMDYFQDESITLLCNVNNAHGCRGWAEDCLCFTVECCPDRRAGPYDIWDNMKCSKRSPNEVYCNNEASTNFGKHCIERTGLKNG